MASGQRLKKLRLKSNIQGNQKERKPDENTMLLWKQLTIYIQDFFIL